MKVKPKGMGPGGTWVAQSGKCLALDLSSGLDPGVVSSSPMLDGTHLIKKKEKDGPWG